MITEYFYDGDLLIAEVYEAEMFVYFYDESGSPLGFGYHDSMSYSEGYFDLFWFEKSMFGDILAVYDEYGNKKVSYSYDAWGNQRTTYHGSDYYIASRNPFRYRGYYYDAELGMYRLQTRYYDSKVGRFINADTTSVLSASPTALTDKNLFAYCDNNPVMRRDDGGKIWHPALVGGLVGGLVGAGTLLTSDLFHSLIAGELVFSSWDQYVSSAAGGAAYGAVMATSGNAHFASAAKSAAETGVSLAIEKLTANSDLSWEDIFYQTAMSGAIGGVTSLGVDIGMKFGKQYAIKHNVVVKVIYKVVDLFSTNRKSNKAPSLISQLVRRYFKETWWMYLLGGVKVYNSIANPSSSITNNSGNHSKSMKNLMYLEM
jgi:RHS repeat-associated protein